MFYCTITVGSNLNLTKCFYSVDRNAKQFKYEIKQMQLLPRVYLVLKRHTASYFNYKVVHEQSGKVEYERERLLGIANKLINFQSGSQQP
jgi:hypothetical protein